MEPIDHAYLIVDGQRVYLWGEAERFAMDAAYGRPFRNDDGSVVFAKPVPAPQPGGAERSGIPFDEDGGSWSS